VASLVPICFSCQRFRGVTPAIGYSCEAYADRSIPVDILASAVDHRKPVAGDHGLQYVPRLDGEQILDAMAAAHSHVSGRRGWPARRGWLSRDEFREAEHPRGGKGSAQGGQFVRKGEGGGGVSSGGGEEPKPEAQTKEQSSPASALFEKETRHDITAEKFMAALPARTHAHIAVAKAKLANSIPTNAPVAEGGYKNPDGTWTEERQKLHDDIIAQLLTPEIVARATPAPGRPPMFTILGGRGGSGKSWLTRKDGPIDGLRAIVFDNDRIKGLVITEGQSEEIPEGDGWKAGLVHEEASDIFNRADGLARELGLNVVHDATMKTPENSEAFVKAFRDAGYDVDGYYMFLPPEVAAQRAVDRFERGGRFVPPEYVLSSRTNEQSFDRVRHLFTKWAVYNNNVPRGVEPQLVASSGG
jgi:predicted kinase